jgi:uncharacterized damage-inducible protein DinB
MGRTQDTTNLADFSVAVRESTLKRLRVVPDSFENWRAYQNGMSFADIAQHIINDPDLKSMKATAGLINITDRKMYNDLIDQLVERGNKRKQLIENLSSEELDELIYDDRFQGKVTKWWLIVRGNLDHEIHHRGQISICLRIVEELCLRQSTGS